jgi:hypothetical protein
MWPLKNRILAVMILFTCAARKNCYAQDMSKLANSKPGAADFSPGRSEIIDSNANAVILFDLGAVHFIGNKHNWFSPVFKKHTRILIMNNKAIGQATVEIFLDTRDFINEKIDNVAASTYNLEGGKVVETKLEKKDFFRTRVKKDLDRYKFTLPAVKDGSIIDYTYTLTSDYDHVLPSWEFQSEEDPCIWSEYQVEVPQTMSYAILKQGFRDYDVNEGSEGRQAYKVTQHNENGGYGAPDQELIVSANTLKHRWAMKNLPAFREENWLSSPVNYMEKIELQQSGWNNGSESFAVSNSWKKFTEELLSNDDFGRPIRDDNDWLDPLLEKILSQSKSQDPARAIYYYVKDHFTCTGYGRYIQTSLQDVVKKNSGNVGEINLLLIAMLRKKGIQADPVLLSTREIGFNPSSYPISDRLRYVIARVHPADGTIRYLDASHRELGFGQLAGDCYNGHARIISDRDSGSVYFEADSLLERKSTLVIMGNGGQNGVEGTYQSVLGMQESYNTRYHVGKEGIDKYFKSFSHGDNELKAYGIDSLDKLEDPVKVHYDFILKQPDADLLYVSPIMGDETLNENPFKAAQRKYPVEIPYVIDDLYSFSMQVPDGYIVDELPKSARITMNEKEGQFEYLIVQNGQQIQIRCHLALKKAFYVADDYNNLRDFFSMMAKKTSEVIVLKKK